MAGEAGEPPKKNGQPNGEKMLNSARNLEVWYYLVLRDGRLIIIEHLSHEYYPYSVFLSHDVKSISHQLWTYHSPQGWIHGSLWGRSFWSRIHGGSPGGFITASWPMLISSATRLWWRKWADDGGWDHSKIGKIVYDAPKWSWGYRIFPTKPQLSRASTSTISTAPLCWLNIAVHGFHWGPDDEETNGHVHPTKGHCANGNSGKLPGKVLKRVRLYNLHWYLKGVVGVVSLILGPPG